MNGGQCHAKNDAGFAPSTEERWACNHLADSTSVVGELNQRESTNKKLIGILEFMKINKVSMAIFAATAILAVSPAVMAQTNQAPGAGAGAGAGGPGGRAGRGGNALTVEAVDKAVTLTEAEKPKVKSALEAYTKSLEEARQADQSERRTKMTAARTDLDKKMKEILTPEQYTKYEAMPGRQGGRRGNRNGGGAGGAGGAGGGANN